MQKKVVSKILLASVLIFSVFAMSFISRKPKQNTRLKPPKTNDTIIINDTVYIYDTVYIDRVKTETVVLYDTVLYIEPIQSKLLPASKDSLIPPKKTLYTRENFLFGRKSNSSLEFLWAANYTTSLFASPPALSSYKNSMDLAFKPLAGYEFGLLFNHHTNFLQIGGGLKYALHRQSYSHTRTKNRIDSVFKYEYFNRTEIAFDTIWFVNIDTLLQTGDTLWVPYIDTNYVSYTDSSLIHTLDTITEVKPTHSINDFKIIEFPLLLKYPFSYKNMKFQLGFGIIPGIIMSSSGKIVSLSNYSDSEDINRRVRIQHFLLSAYLSGGINFSLTPRYNLHLNFYMKELLSSVYRNNPVSQRHRSIGIGFSLVYRL